MYLFFIHSLGFYLSFVLFDFLFAILPPDDSGNYIAHLVICFFVYLICSPVVFVVFLLDLFFGSFLVANVISVVLYFIYGLSLLFNINGDLSILARGYFAVFGIAAFSVILAKIMKNLFD